MKVRKIVNRLHLWIGLASGIFVFLISISGAVLVFEDELKPILYADKYHVAVSSGNRMPLHVLLQNAQERFGMNKPVAAIEISNNPERSVRFRAYLDNEGPGIWYWDEKAYYESVFLDTYTGKVIAWENSEFEFFRVALYLHWSLLLTTSLGQPVVGVIALIFVISLISGLFLWWPRSKKTKSKRFKFSWRTQTGVKRKIYDLHNILGFYVSVLALLIALIGLTWAFPSLGDALTWVANGGNAPQAKSRLKSSIASPNALAIDKVLEKVIENHHEADAYYFYLPKSPSATINLVIADQGKRHSAVTAQYDRYSATLLKELTFNGQSSGDKLSAINYDIHLGRIAGLPTKIIAFFVAIVCATLPLTGFLIWVKRNKKV